MKIKRLFESKINFEDKIYHVLSEVNLNRIIKGHEEDGYVIISPCRSKENLEREIGEPLNDQQAVDENSKRVKELKNYLNSNGFSYIPVLGGYHEEGVEKSSYEKSFIVYPFNRKGEKVDFEEFFDKMLAQAEKYNQDSILRKAPGEKAQYITQDGNVDMEFNGVTLNGISQEYFTAIKKFESSSEKGKPQRFSFECLYFNAPGSIMETHKRYSLNELLYPYGHINEIE